MNRRFVAAATVAALLATIAGCSDDDAGKHAKLYAATVAPPVPDRTATIDPSWVESSGETLGTDVADGTYWAEAVGVGESTAPFITFDLSQAVFGPTCTATFPSDPSACDDDYAVIDEPHGELPAFVPSIRSASVVGEDQRNYSITGAELHSLISGAPPAAAAPDEYAYAPFGFLVEVQGGTITSAHQIWTP